MSSQLLLRLGFLNQRSAKRVSRLSHCYCCMNFDGNSVSREFDDVERLLHVAQNDNLQSGFNSLHSESSGNFLSRREFIQNAKQDADRVFEILQQDGPGFDVKSALDNLHIRVSGILVREVLFRVLKTVNYANRVRAARLGYKFFVWSGKQREYKLTTDSYHLIMKVFLNTQEYGPVWRLVDEMIEKGFTVNARTFNILMCASGEAGLGRKIVEKFVMSKSFNFRPYKHSYNAILHSLLVMKQYRLIEWVYDQMAGEYGCDVLTYNIALCAKYRLGKLDQFHRLLDEMGRNGVIPDLHTYNILLHVLGKGDKPLGALNLLNHMKEVGIEPSVLHFTTLIDGLSRAGNLDACRYFFVEMVKNGFVPDVVCYTVMITGYVVCGEFEKAEELFGEMIRNGQLPNVYTYNAMIRGLCIGERFDEACAMIMEMESKGCNPNFVVYSTLLNNLRNAGRLSQAHQIINHMVEKGRYVYVLPKYKTYRRS